MEMVRDVDLLAHVRGATATPVCDTAVSDPAYAATVPMIDSGRVADVVAPRSRGPRGDTTRLRPAFLRLVDGLHALHTTGKVHRDIKPENVLVDADGRGVILDFGLVGDVMTWDSAIVGTIAYMAPEQGNGLPVGPAADWYCVGVLLYEALTGHYPFSGAGLQFLLDKQNRTPTAPRELDPTVPVALDALCMRMLRPDPGERRNAGPLEFQPCGRRKVEAAFDAGMVTSDRA